MRGTVGGRHALITRYAFTRPDGPPLRKETYAVYLGAKQVVLHVFLPAQPGTQVEEEARAVIASLRLGRDQPE